MGAKVEFPIGKKLFLLVVNPGTFPFVSSEHFFLICSRGDQVPDIIACVASVSVLFRESKTAQHSRAAKTENPVPRSIFAPKQHGNACYAGY